MKVILRVKALYIYIIDQVRGQDNWILAKFSFCVFMDGDKAEVHKNAKREQGQCDLFFFPVLCLKLFSFYEHFKKQLHIL